MNNREIVSHLIENQTEGLIENQTECLIENQTENCITLDGESNENTFLLFSFKEA